MAVATKKLARYAGYCILAGSAGFLLQRFYDQAGELGAAEIPGPFVALTFLLSTIYGVSQLLLVGAMAVTLRALGVASAGFVQVLDLYGRSAIAKYLPGNIFHIVGRQVIAAGYGWPQWTIALASMTEAAVLTASAAALGILLGSLSGYLQVIVDLDLNFAVPVAAFGVAVVMTWGAGCFASRLPFLQQRRSAALIEGFCRSVAPANTAALYAAFLVSTGVLFWVMLAVLRGEWHARDVALLVFAYVVSWLAGYVTPGAPGGLGVREAILVLLLSPRVGSADALLLAAALRLVTMVGDAVLFVAALWVRRFIIGKCNAVIVGS